MVKEFYEYELNNHEKTKINTFYDINDSKIKDLKVHKPKTVASGEISKEDIRNYEKTISFDIFKILKSFLSGCCFDDIGYKETFNLYNPNDIKLFNEMIKLSGIYILIKELREKGYRIGYFTKPRITSDIRPWKLTGDFNDIRIFGIIKNGILKMDDDEDIENFSMSFLYLKSDFNEEIAKEYLLNIIKANLLICPFDDEVLNTILPDSMDITFGKPSCKLILDTDCICYDLKDDLGIEISKFLLFRQYINFNKTYAEYINIGIDFDGVIHLHDSKFKKSGELDYNPNIAVIKTLKKLKENSRIKITIFTMRAYDDKYKKQVEEYLNKYDIPYDEISYLFNNFVFLLDDRCLRLNDKLFLHYHNHKQETEYISSNKNHEILISASDVISNNISKEISEIVKNTIDKIDSFEPWHKQDSFGDLKEE